MQQLTEKPADNPMTLGLDKALSDWWPDVPEPQIVCSHCGAEWFEISDGWESDKLATHYHPLSASGKRCQNCVGLCATNDDCYEFLDGLRSYGHAWADVMIYAIGATGTWSASVDDSKMFLDSLRETDKEQYWKLLADYIDDKQRSEFVEYLMEKY